MNRIGLTIQNVDAIIDLDDTWIFKQAMKADLIPWRSRDRYDMEDTARTITHVLHNGSVGLIKILVDLYPLRKAPIYRALKSEHLNPKAKKYLEKIVSL